MPRPAMLPTPASSTEIKGQDDTKHQLSSLQMSFELPPSAMEAARTTSPTALSPKTPYPMQPSETVKSRRRSSAAAAAAATAHKETFALPPPPTRSRKIIQMKPGGQEALPAEPSSVAAKTQKNSSSSSSGGNAQSTSTTTTRNATAAAAAAEAAGSGSKKKQPPSATSAAGRKVARKTAHSLIERRRRSKMNEEFAVLKGLIPACTGEMHKLAILQASIDYVRYLEDCISKLKSQRNAEPLQTLEAFRPSASGMDEEEPAAGDGSDGCGDGYGDDDRVEPAPPEDVEMTTLGSEVEEEQVPSPTTTTAYSSFNTRTTTHPQSQPHSKQPSTSPALLPQDGAARRGSRQHSYASLSTASTDQRRRYSGYSTPTSTATTSPVVVSGSATAAYSGYGCYAATATTAPASSRSALTSPALGPQPEDREATAALLMLNADRRGMAAGASSSSSSSRGSARGMSVRDLLSS